VTECGHVWPSKPGETITYENVGEVPARGSHRCIKDSGHINDITDDDHKCCCGNNTWVTP
jgi:hypothetical protein